MADVFPQKSCCSFRVEKLLLPICGNDNNIPTVIYVCGGNRAPYKKCEYYDINKNRWYEMKDTEATHNNWPVLWMENANILNIASTSQFVFEQMDLRENIWRKYIGHDTKETFESMFGCKIHSATKTRLLLYI